MQFWECNGVILKTYAFIFLFPQTPYCQSTQSVFDKSSIVTLTHHQQALMAIKQTVFETD